MRRRLYAAAVLASVLVLEGCSEPVPTVNMNAPPPTGPPPPAVPGVLKKPSKGKAQNAPAPTTPNAL